MEILSEGLPAIQEHQQNQLLQEALGALERTRTDKCLWYPIGIERLRTSPTDNFVRATTILGPVREMMRRNGIIFVANPSENIFTRLVEENPDTDPAILDAEAKQRAHLIGLYEKFSLMAMQSVEQKRVPIPHPDLTAPFRDALSCLRLYETAHSAIEDTIETLRQYPDIEGDTLASLRLLDWTDKIDIDEVLSSLIEEIRTADESGNESEATESVTKLIRFERMLEKFGIRDQSSLREKIIHNLKGIIDHPQINSAREEFTQTGKTGILFGILKTIAHEPSLDGFDSAMLGEIQYALISVSDNPRVNEAKKALLGIGSTGLLRELLEEKSQEYKRETETRERIAREETSVLAQKELERRESVARTYHKVPVVLMSELAKTKEFQSLHAQITDLTEINNELAEEIYKCVPEDQRHRKHKGKTLAQLKELPGKEALQTAIKRMRYVIFQIAIVLFIEGVKVGHVREIPYNTATAITADLISIPPQGQPSFETITTPEEEETVEDGTPKLAYRGTFVFKDMQTSISMARNPRKGARTSEDIRKIKDDITAMEEIDRRAELAHSKLEEDIDFANSTHDEFMKAVATSDQIDESERTFLMETKAMHHIQQIVLHLANRPRYYFIFQHTGVLDVILGKKTINELGENNLLPFSCDRQPGETDPAYFSRFVAELIQGNNGPAEDGRYWENWLRDRELARNISRNAGQCDDEFQRDKWTCPYAHLRWKTLSEDCPWKLTEIEEKDPISREAKRWALIGRLFELIKGTDLENILKAYLEGNIYDGNPPVIEPETAPVIIEIIQSQYFTSGFREMIMGHLTTHVH